METAMKDQEKNCESGMIILEGTFCILICLLVTLLLMSLGFYLYQRVMVTVVTNEVATTVAETYKLTDAEDSAHVTIEHARKTRLFRYLFNGKGYVKANESKARQYANARLTKTSLAVIERAPTVSVSAIHDDVGRYHYKVVVSQKYTFLLGELLKLIGIDTTQDISSTSYVRGADILHYVNAVRTVKYFTSARGSIGKAVESCIKAVNSLATLVKDITTVETPAQPGFGDGGGGGGGFRGSDSGGFR